MRNLPLTFDYSTYSQKKGEDFAKFCGLLRIYELNDKKKLVVFGRKMTEPGIVTPPDAILSSYCCHNSEGTHCRSCCKHIFYKYVHIGRHV